MDLSMDYLPEFGDSTSFDMHQDFCPDTSLRSVRSVASSIFETFIKGQLEKNQSEMFLHIGCGAGETVTEMWNLTEGYTLCVGVSLTVGNGIVDTPEEERLFEFVPCPASGILDLGRCRMCVEQLPLQKDLRFSMRPWLFEGSPEQESTGLLLAAAKVILVSAEAGNSNVQKHILKLCSTFCQEGAIVVSAQTCIDTVVSSKFDKPFNCWKRVGSIMVDVCDFIFGDDLLYAHQLTSSLEERVWQSLKMHSATISYISVQETVRSCLLFLMRGRRSITRREVQGAANKAKSLVMMCLEGWDILYADRSKRVRDT